MNFYKDYNILVGKIEKAEDKELQARKNLKSVSYKRLTGIMKLKYDKRYLIK